jgi:hypothetical protein
MEVFNGERISIKTGKNPIILISPHSENPNIGLIARSVAEITDSYYITNNGWECSKIVDQQKDKANCNNSYHCHENVVKDEFLNPLVSFKNKILKDHKNAFIFYLLDAENSVIQECGDPSIGYIIGYGAGDPYSASCFRWVRNCFIYTLSASENCHIYEGKTGSKHAGWEKDDMNQLFTKWYPEDHVQSMQIKIVKDLTDTTQKATITAEILAICANKLLQTTNFNLPQFFINRKI